MLTVMIVMVMVSIMLIIMIKMVTLLHKRCLARIKLNIRTPVAMKVKTYVLTSFFILCLLEYSVINSSSVVTADLSSNECFCYNSDWLICFRIFVAVGTNHYCGSVLLITIALRWLPFNVRVVKLVYSIPRSTFYHTDCKINIHSLCQTGALF